MKRQIILMVLLTASFLSFSQTRFRSGIFLHHSTGDNIWGPNGSATSIPQEIAVYNSSHGFTGENVISMDQSWWPDGVNNGNNEWECWHRIFENQDLSDSDIRGILTANKIIVIKSCFPSSAIDRMGQPSDTLTPTEKTIYNYKWHWRHIIKVMKSHPENFFAIWSNAPMTSGQTDATSAANSKKFCKWAKDTLAKGLDPVIGVFPKNIYVFDYFSKVTDGNGFLQNQYAVSTGDSHPNAAATALVAPQFVNEIFTAAISYESLLTGIMQINDINLTLYPNPARGEINIDISYVTENLNLSLYNAAGLELFHQPVKSPLTKINISSLSPGIYFIKFISGEMSEVKKILIK